MRRIALMMMIGVLVLIPLSAMAQGSGNLNVFIGSKTLDEDDWEPVDEQLEIGGMFDYRPPNWPLSLAVDLLYSFGEEEAFGTELENRFYELDVGAKLILENPSIISPFIAGGIAFVEAEAEGDFWDTFDFKDEASGTGLWLSGGAYLTLNRNLNLGLNIRWSDVEADWEHHDIDLGGARIGGFIGLHW